MPASMQEGPEEWPAPVLAMLEYPDLSAADRATLDKLRHWRAPGEKGLATLRAIGAKLAAVAACALATQARVTVVFSLTD